MKVTTKTTLILLGVFLLGIVAGVIATKSRIHHRFRHRVEKFQRGEGFIPEMEALIAPTPEQREQVRAILENHSAGMKTLMDQQRVLFMKKMDSLRTELDSVLTPEQVARLTSRLDRFRGRPGPPPPPRRRHH